MTDLVPISDRSDKPIQYAGLGVLERLGTLRQAEYEFRAQWQASLAKANLWVWPSEYVASVEKDLLRAKNRWVFNWRDFRPADWTKMTPLWYGVGIASVRGLIHLGDGWYSFLGVIGLLLGILVAFSVLSDFECGVRNSLSRPHKDLKWYTVSLADYVVPLPEDVMKKMQDLAHLCKDKGIRTEFSVLHATIAGEESITFAKDQLCDLEAQWQRWQREWRFVCVKFDRTMHGQDYTQECIIASLCGNV
jgi:hypothetical protein